MLENKAEEIIKALRCSGSPGGPESCDGCPYKFREQLPKELWGEHGGKYVDGCDTDKIVLDAADLLEKLMAENEALKTKLWPEYCQDMAEYSCPRVARLRQEIDHLREVTKIIGEDTNVPTKWVSVEKRMPEPGEPVLCHCADGKLRVMSWDHIFENWNFAIIYGHCHTLSCGSATHWQPLPEPPSTEGVE